jgi:hypothetical protein
LTGEAGNASRRKVIVEATARSLEWASAWRTQDESGPTFSRVIRTNFGGRMAKIFRENSDSLAEKRGEECAHIYLDLDRSIQVVTNNVEGGPTYYDFANIQKILERIRANSMKAKRGLRNESDLHDKTLELVGEFNKELDSSKENIVQEKDNTIQNLSASRLQDQVEFDAKLAQEREERMQEKADMEATHAQDKADLEAKRAQDKADLEAKRTQDKVDFEAKLAEEKEERAREKAATDAQIEQLRQLLLVQKTTVNLSSEDQEKLIENTSSSPGIVQT